VEVNILAWLITGMIAGAIAKALMPGNDPGGLILTVVLGIAGAIVGGFLSVALGLGNGIDGFDIGTIFLAVAGALLLLVGYRMLGVSAASSDGGSELRSGARGAETRSTSGQGLPRTPARPGPHR
jgi:uncharacterized membrane protein YeaQ/YmgE (transglycosylase-associated protein family)